MKRNHPLLASLEADQTVVWPSLESRDIDEAIQDATELTAAAAAGRAIRSASADAGHIQINLESMYEMLSSLNAAGGLTASQLGLAQLNMVSLGQTLGLPPVSLGISMESFTEEVPLQQVSLEELEQLIVTIEENHADLAADAVDSVDQHCEILKSALPNCALRLDALIKRAQESQVQGGTQVAGDGIADYLMCGDEFPSDFPGYMDRYVALGEKVCNSFMPAAVKCAETACSLKDASFENEEAFAETTAKGFDAALDPRNCFTDEDYETALPGNGPLFASEADYTGGGEGHFAAMDQFSNCNCPCDPSDFSADGDVPVELPALSSADIVRTATALRDLVMECDTAQFQEDAAQTAPALDDAARTFSVSYDNASDDVLSALGDKVVTVSTYLANAKAMAQWTPICFLTNLAQTINAFIVYAERSLGEDVVSTENLNTANEDMSTNLDSGTDNGAGTGMGDGISDGTGLEGATISLEGGGIKLRTGMKVKYSRGYGKIVKIFDRPTKYKGEIHHCSKDNPKYEVKSDMGNKLSLHKASALTPV